jgi:hypothetical protein
MKMRKALLGILVGIVPLGSMEVPVEVDDQGGENRWAGQVERLENSVALVQKILSPLQEDAQRIEAKTKAFDEFLKQEQWDEEALKKVLVAYQNLEEEVDTFPLRYRPLLDKLRHEYRMEKSVDGVIRAYAMILNEITFKLFKYIPLMFEFKEVDAICRDVHASLVHQHIPLNEFEISGLKKYQHWSWREYQGLQKYLNGRAATLLARIHHREELQQHHKEIEQEEERLSRCARELERYKQQVYENVLSVEDLVRKPVLEEADMHQLSERYEELVTAKKHLNTLKAVAENSSFVSCKGKADQRKKLAQQLGALHEDCSSMVARCEHLRISELKNIFTTFAAAHKDSKEKKEKKQIEDRWFLADARKKWIVPFPPYYVEHLSRLVVWNSECEPLQSAVRVQAKKYLQQSEDISHSAACGQRVASCKQKSEVSPDALKKSKTVFIEKIEKFLRRDS